MRGRARQPGGASLKGVRFFKFRTEIFKLPLKTPVLVSFMRTLVSLRDMGSPLSYGIAIIAFSAAASSSILMMAGQGCAASPMKSWRRVTSLTSINRSVWGMVALEPEVVELMPQQTAA